MRITEYRDSPLKAKQVAIKCDQCGKLCFIDFVYGTTAQGRMQLIHNALAEHRQIACQGGEAADGRKYEIWYPRS